MNILKDIYQIHSSDYTYHLPDEKIAKFPISPRDHSKLLVYQNREIHDKVFTDITNYLTSNHLIVLNNTKVIQARLIFQRETGGKIEVFLLEPENLLPELALQSTQETTWKCLVGNAKKWKKEEKLTLNCPEGQITVSWKNKEQDNFIVHFQWNFQSTFGEILEKFGNLPLPPYLNRETAETDIINYQTVFARNRGAVAAPTAGLHFTPEILKKLENQKVKTAEITLHVGGGTFKPWESKLLQDHVMHTESFSVSQDTLKIIYHHHGSLVSVGTTSLRTLESLYWLALADKNILHQWDSYRLDATLKYRDAIEILIEKLEKNHETFFNGQTQLIIAPGYHFQSSEVLVTNFHQPNSTLLLLVAAWVGEDWKKIYEHALQNQYRFLSYGDSSILFRNL